MSESIESTNRVVVDGEWEGNVVPRTAEELLRQVILRPRAVVTGCIFGHSIRVEGPAQVAHSVYASKDLELIPEEGDIRLCSCAGAKEQLVALPTRGRALISGDVVARSVSLSNTVVRGSIHADEVRLDSCLVLGLVRSADLAELESSVLLSIDAARLTFKQGCGLILPYARAAEKLTMDDEVRLISAGPQEHRLGPHDVVNRGGAQHLTGGRRMTDLAQVNRQMENIGRFMTSLAIGDAVQSQPGQLAYDPELLPTAVTRLLPSEL